MKLENIKIGNTRLGSWSETMNTPDNWWCPIVWKFNLVVFPTMVFLETWCF